MMEFLDRDFLLLGEVKEGLDVAVTTYTECDWYCKSSISKPEKNVSSIHHMLTVINNKIFYLESLIWEMDYNEQFSKDIYFDITVYDVSV